MSKSMTTCQNENATKSGGSHSSVSEIKVKFSYKLTVFIGAVVALSWFFEGCRKVQESFSAPHLAILLVGTLLTVLFVGIYAYWIYLEEKLKGTLKKRIELFEKIHVFLVANKGDGRG